MASLSRAVGEALADALNLRGRAVLALSGGETPKAYLPAIAALDLDWRRIRVTLADERFVASDHPDSNARLVRSLLLQGPTSRCEWIAPNFALGLADGAAEWAARLAEGPWPIDLLVLGLGLDGHIASLFPRSAALSDSNAFCRCEPAAPGRGARWTLSLKAVESARRLFVVFAGPAKASVWAKAQRARAPTPDLPATYAAAHPHCLAFDLS